MAFEEHHTTIPGLPVLGNNLANLIIALVGTPASLVVGGLGIANRVLGGASRETTKNEAGCVQYTCDGAVVRHHYRYCCVPPCYRCTRDCS